MLRTTLGTIAGLAVAVAGVAFFVWLLWWLWSRREEEETAPVIELKPEPSTPAVEAEGEEEAPAPELEEVVPDETEPEEAPEAPVEEIAPEAAPVPDDLTRIAGIGPKIASVLQEAGIMTFAQLADTDAGSLEEILEASDPRLRRLAKPETWPEQAALAAAEGRKAHEAFRGDLEGGGESEQ